MNSVTLESFCAIEYKSLYSEKEGLYHRFITLWDIGIRH